MRDVFDRKNGSLRPGRQRWEYVSTAGAVLVAIASFAAAYGTLLQPHDGSSPRRISDDRGHRHAAQWEGTYASEKGPLGLRWQWMDDEARLSIAPRGRFWVSFWGYSHSVRRTLRFASPPFAQRVRLSGVPRLYLIGPIDSRGTLNVYVRSTPAGTRPRGTDTRALAARLSAPFLSKTSAAVIPAQGFFPAELDGEGEPYFWMQQDGHLEVIARGRRHVRLTFLVSSVLPRILRISQGKRLTPRWLALRIGAVARITYGPISLTNGRATVRLRAMPGPSRWRSDPRPLSIQIRRLRASFPAKSEGVAP